MLEKPSPTERCKVTLGEFYNAFLYQFSFPQHCVQYCANDIKLQIQKPGNSESILKASKVFLPAVAHAQAPKTVCMTIIISNCL